MFRNLLKRIFDNTPEQDLPREVEPPRILDISEPVYKMVEVVKARPSRVKSRKVYYDYPGYWSKNIYKVTDIKTTEEFSLTKITTYDMYGEAHSSYNIEHNIQFTRDEINLLVSEIKPIIDARIERAGRIKSIRSLIEQGNARKELCEKLSI